MAKTLTGARAAIFVNETLVGLFDSCSYGSNLGTEDIFTLGKFGAQEIVPTSYEVVSLNCSGFRIVNQGAHILPKFPKLEDLLNLEAIRINIVDRQTGANIMTVTGCVPTSYSGGFQAKATSRIQITYRGLKLTDESGDQNEIGATELP